jgi:hypothetical protein
MAVAFFIVAHSDDWFLFMGNAGLEAFGDGQNGNTICFVYVTATNFIDGTNVAMGDEVRQRYEEGLRVREDATINMMADYFDAPSDFVVKRINDRDIAFYEVANTRHYCLRLADGLVDGSGVAWNGNQSLMQLKQSGKAMTAQGDIPAQYGSWNDLTGTLRAIFDAETNGDHCWLNYLDPDDAAQDFPLGHSDHRHVGLAVRDAVEGAENYDHARFRGYSIIRGKANLTGRRKSEKTRLIRKWDDLQTGFYPSIWHTPYQEWAERQYMIDDEMHLLT